MQPIRFALIGYGAWGGHHARAISSVSGAALVAIADNRPESRDRAAEEHPQARVYGDHRELLAREEVDAVAVVLPTHVHYEVAKDVLESGRHLLLEKPMALTLSQCDQLNALAESRGRRLAVGHEFRVSALWGKVKELIDTGAIGEPLYAMIELWRNPYRLGSEGWRYDIARVGNWILEEPIHFFDLARWYFSAAGDPLSVFAQANARRPDHLELQDNFTAVLTFPQGRYAVVSQTLAGWEHHQVVKITGTEGALWANWSGAMDRTFHPTFWLKRMQGDKVEEIPIAKMTGEVYELVDQAEAFVACIREDSAPVVSGWDGRWSVAMCLKAQESVESGRPVGF
jgi:myo-inositol 2-dehydrogenase/D-chiro-inositol 1-dehydrogenase